MSKVCNREGEDHLNKYVENSVTKAKNGMQPEEPGLSEAINVNRKINICPSAEMVS